MAPQAQPGEPAKFNYQEVRYSPFGAPPGESLVLTADPWSYLYAWLEKHKKGKRTKKREALSRAAYYAELAEGFSNASELTALPTKGTLAYYALLNLVKCFISVRGVTLERVKEHHGISLNRVGKVKINPNASRGNVNIFHEFSKQLGTPVQGSHALSLEEICCHIPELHEIAFSLDALPNVKRKFLPVRIQLMVNAKHTALFTEMSYDKSHEAKVPYQRFYRGTRQDYFKQLEANGERVVFRSKGRKQLKRTKENWNRIHSNICSEYAQFDLVSLLTRRGYRYYCDLEPGGYHHLCYSFLVLFYIGSLARYRPTETQALLKSDRKPLITEAIALCPKQFLYHVVSLITKRVCTVPFASL